MNVASNGPDISVVVVTWNSAAVLPSLLVDLPTALGDIAAEVIVVDNASSDDTVAVAARLAPLARVVQMGGNRGYAAAFNAGVRVATAREAVLLLNPDIRPMPNFLPCLLHTLRTRPEAGIAVPRLIGPDGSTAPSLRREPTVFRAFGEAVLGGSRAGRFPALGEVVCEPARYEVAGMADWASGAAMLISRRCLDTVGPWDESFFLYSEETDFALRARDARFELWYVPEAEAVHVGGTVHESPELWGLLAANRVRVFRRRHGALPTVLFWAAVLLNEGLRSRRSIHRAAAARLVGLRRDDVPRPLRGADARPALPRRTVEGAAWQLSSEAVGRCRKASVRRHW